jgi:hypothetical protein
LPCGRGNRVGVCAPICSVDRSASRLSVSAGLMFADRRGSPIDHNSRLAVDRSGCAPWRALAIRTQKAPFPGLPACSKSRGLYGSRGLPVNARRDLVMNVKGGREKRSSAAAARVPVDRTRGLRPLRSGTFMHV